MANRMQSCIVFSYVGIHPHVFHAYIVNDSILDIISTCHVPKAAHMLDLNLNLN